MYTLNNSLIYQRHYNVDKSTSLYEYVNANITESFDDTYYVIAHKDNIYELNLIGSLILEEIQNGNSIDQITIRLLRIYKTEYDELKKDIIDFISYLQEVNIIKNE